MSQEISSATENQFTIKQVQEIYNELTGMVETTSGSRNESVIVTLDNLIQLHHMIKQTCESHPTTGLSSAVTVYHNNGHKDTHTSFERFKLYSVGNTAPIENINLKFNFLLRNAENSKVKSYEISIDITSTAAVLERKIDDPAERFAVGFLSSVPPIRYTIRYIDYVIARTFRQAIEEWAESLEKNKKSRSLIWAQSYSHWIKNLITLSAPCALLIFSYFALLERAEISNNQLATIGIGLTAGCLILHFIAKIIGTLTELGIDSLSQPSHFRINTGDKNCFDRRRNSNKKAIVKSVVGIVSSIILSLSTELFLKFFLE